MHRPWINQICRMTKIQPNIFRLPLDGLSSKQLFERLEKKGGLTWIATVNAEILLEARQDKSYLNILQQADVRMIDGSGPAYLLRLFGYHVSRVAGVDLAEQLIEWASQKGLRVGMIGGIAPDTGKRAAEVMKKKYPSLQVMAEHGGFVNREGEDDAGGEEARYRLTQFAPQVLLVAFGHPKQERWIAKYTQDFPELKVIIGLGGTFEYWAGAAKRAPKFLQILGLEWLWRLVTEPSRIKRIFRAVVVFPFYFLIDRFS